MLALLRAWTNPPPAQPGELIAALREHEEARQRNDTKRMGRARSRLQQLRIEGLRREVEARKMRESGNG